MTSMLVEVAARAEKTLQDVRESLEAHPLLSAGDYVVTVVSKANKVDTIRIRLYNREDKERARVVVKRPVFSQ